ncbi:hypothetical protein ACIHFB_40740 [Streptomyces sp. NPDC051963]|uniref:hypothetical protein n=1 Tax=Streptomyces sp. NPDC051963 TaxID=3365678 RepID=UPI0037D43A39
MKLAAPRRGAGLYRYAALPRGRDQPRRRRSGPTAHRSTFSGALVTSAFTLAKVIRDRQEAENRAYHPFEKL